MLNFSYVAEHLGDDMAVGRWSGCCNRSRLSRTRTKSLATGTGHLLWLNDVLSEVWQNRGRSPASAACFNTSAVESGTAFQRAGLVPLLNKGENAWEYVLAILEGRRKCDNKQYAKALEAGRRTVGGLQGTATQSAVAAGPFRVVARPGGRIANPDKRAACGISATDEQLVANPYLLSEMDQGDGESDLIALETIDRGMRPEGDAARFHRQGRNLRPGRSAQSARRSRCRAARSGAARRHSAPIRRNRQPHHRSDSQSAAHAALTGTWCMGQAELLPRSS